MSTTVVCGMDGSRCAEAALEEALRRAAGRGGDVRVVAAFRPPEQWATWAWAAAAGVALPASHEIARDLRGELRGVVARVRESLAGELVPVPEVTVRAEPGTPADVLVSVAAEAAEVVVGHHGRGLRSGLGSVALGCVLHAPCPVTVVPQPLDADPEVPAASGTLAAAP